MHLQLHCISGSLDATTMVIGTQCNATMIERALRIALQPGAPKHWCIGELVHWHIVMQLGALVGWCSDDTQWPPLLIPYFLFTHSTNQYPTIPYNTNTLQYQYTGIPNNTFALHPCHVPLPIST